MCQRFTEGDIFAAAYDCVMDNVYREALSTRLMIVSVVRRYRVHI